MKFIATPIAGAFLVELEPKVDSRGEFARAFCRREFMAQGIRFDILQSNLVRSHKAGSVRGLHYQLPPAQEQKFVRCVGGAVFDVLVDMRPESPTRMAVFEVRLDAENKLALFMPTGVAHGYQVLVDGTDFLYMTDQYYGSGTELGVRFNDPALGIHWPLPPVNVADRDMDWPPLSTSQK